MRRLLTFTAACTLCLATLIRGQNPPEPQATFRTGVDLIQVDVSVLDRDRHPVRGLTAADFTVLEDGRSRPIKSFSAVDVPPPVAQPAAWMTDVAPDVATNTHPTGRIVVVVIDDGALYSGGRMWGLQKTKAAAKAVVMELGPDDLTAIVFTEFARTSQNFTTDRTRLLSAIDTSVLFPGGHTTGVQLEREMLQREGANQRGSCVCGLCSIETLGHVAEALRSVQQQRKTILYISPGLPLNITMEGFVPLPAPFATQSGGCEDRKYDALLDVFRQAQLANVTISSIDPNGVPSSYPEFLRTIAENTGGRAVVNDNDPERHVPALLLESSSYYLLGFESAGKSAAAGFHRIQVKVNGRDVEVRARSGYYDTNAKDKKAASKAVAPGSLDAAIGGQLPTPDLPMQVSVAPFADGSRKPALAIALGVTQPANAAQRALSDVKAANTVDVLASVFDSEGRSFGSRRLTVRPAPNANGAGDLQYEVLPRLPVAPGRYELRLAVRTSDARTGSVYTFVDVPQFAREVLSLSGLVMGVTPSVASAPADAYADLLPIVPTARREFATTDRVTAFLRVYQGGSRAMTPVTMTTRLIDARNQQVSESVRTLDVASFGKTRSFDDRFDVPIRNLASGEYLLTVDVAAAGKTAQRASRFRVR
jgi:VWFA-related protein